MVLLKVCRAIRHDLLLSIQSIGRLISGGGSANVNNYSREMLFLEADNQG